MMYADPGSGVLIWQILLALFFGITFSFSKVKTWAINRFRPAHKFDQQEDAFPTKSASEVE